MKSSTIRSTGELARLLGLSRWTVSRALNGHADIAPETAAHVRSEAERLGFSPSLIGRSLRSGKTDLIGVSLPDLEDYFLTAKVSLLQRRLEAAGWRPLMQIGGSAGAERAAYETFASMRCAGVVALASRVGVGGFATLQRSGIPAVAVDPIVASGIDEVRTDRAHAMRAVLEHLHAAGHRSVVTAGLDGAGGGYGSARFLAIEAGAGRLGWKSGSVIPLNAPAPGDLGFGSELARRYLAMPRRRPRAVIALNDRVAFGFVRTLQEGGLRVPGDVAVTGYDDSELARFSDPPLTSVDPQSERLIEAAVGLLGRRIGGEEARKPAGLRIRPLLVVRGSA